MTGSHYAGGYPPVPADAWDRYESQRFLEDANALIDRLGDYA